MKHNTFVHPVITEKSMDLASRKWYSFRVDLHLTKKDIAKLIEDQFKVHVVDVRTLSMHGKAKRTGKKRIEQVGADWKKALVKVLPNESIDLFSVEEGPKK
jgi:ribosomal protein L23